MFELAVTASGARQPPAIRLQEPEQVCDFQSVGN
jgi:hypothetical protein